MHKLIINLNSEKSAKYLKKELEEKYPLLHGNITVYNEPQIKPLNEIIENEKKKVDK